MTALSAGSRNTRGRGFRAAAGHNPADLHEAEAEPEQGVRHERALVEASRESDRIREAPAEHIDGEAGIVGGRRNVRQGGQRPDRQIVGALGIEPVQQRAHQGKGGGDHRGGIPSGRRWAPSAPTGISATSTTAESGNSP